MDMQCILRRKVFAGVDKLATSDPNEPVTAVMCFPCSFRQLAAGKIPSAEERQFLEDVRAQILAMGPEAAAAWGIGA